jgi:YidC/Oxa1 family membrane protein insertase
MLAQFPVFISLYYMLRIDLRYDICPDINEGLSSPKPCGSTPDSQFFFISDLTDKATGSTLAILIVLYVGSQLLSTLLMSTTTDKTQRMIFLALPFIFVLFVIQFPAGLLVYWITTNLWTIVQQAIIRKRLGPLRPPGADTGGGLFGLGGGGGGGKPTPESPSDGGGPSLRKKEPAGVGAEPKGRPSGRPPAPPRKKKKRSGRRR